MRFAIKSLLVFTLLLGGCSAKTSSNVTDSEVPSDNTAQADTSVNPEDFVFKKHDKDANGCITDRPKLDTLNLLREDRFVVGTAAGFEPFEFIKDDAIQGFDIDVYNELAKRLCLPKVEYINISFDTIITALNGGQFDASAAGMTITPERQQSVLFTKPYFEAEQAMLVPSNSDITSFDDLDEDALIGVQAGTTGEIWLKENKPDIKIQSFPVAVGAVTAMNAGQLEAVFLDSPVVASHVNSGQGKIAFVQSTSEHYGIAVPKNNEALVKALNLALEDFVASGDYAKTYTKWFEGDVPEVFKVGK